MSLNLDQSVQLFLAGSSHAVVGASRDRHKFGNKVLRTYIQTGRPVHPVNPFGGLIENLPCFPTLRDIPEPVHGISIITPPHITEQIIDEAAALGIKHIWIQPGAESPAALARAHHHSMNVIAGGPCILVVLGFPN